MLQSQHILPTHFPFSHLHNHFLSPSSSSSSSSPLTFIHGGRPIITLRATPLRPRPRPEPWLARASDPTTTDVPEEKEEGPMEFFQSTAPIFATSDEPSSLQVATSVLLTGSIAVFLFRSLRRRARRAKELKFRSDGVKKSVKEEALETLKAMGSASVEAKSTPSPIQALLGGISAGVIALILYKFTTTIEAALNRQTLSDNFSVQQITITIRTIINGLCYLATFVFGINSVGLVLYAGQLAINSFMEEESTSKETESKNEDQSGSLSSTAETPTNTGDSIEGRQSSDDSQ
ncbi:uncharacterized protein LOC133800494 [Humulus lupulus]|uniref:uncharacterized protein LOC133800494 n=1 Tax=Humulus lupulus TaxID=3486 RepID=UPI002B416784|nr:uncharacterized protein LOC133800494 [Humulus lupulus]